jgi:hypothetical protein
MIDSEWLECTDPTLMLHFVRGKASDRKLRLFALACCYRIKHLLTDPVGMQAVEIAERIAEREAAGVPLDDFTDKVWNRAFQYIDGFRTERDSSIAYHSTAAAYDLLPPVLPPTFDSSDLQSDLLDTDKLAAWVDTIASPSPDLLDTPTQVAWAVANALRKSDDDVVREEVFHQELKDQLPLLRDIVGNPFRRVSFNLVWQTPTVTNIAQAAYEERALPSGELDPARLAVLSDALEEAGCNDANILGHLRSPGPHVRGCWAVDLLLGKE